MSIGIDIGKYSTKIVELSLTKGEVVVKKIGSLNTFEDINKFDLEKILTEKKKFDFEFFFDFREIIAQKASVVIKNN